MPSKIDPIREFQIQKSTIMIERMLHDGMVKTTNFGRGDEMGRRSPGIWVTDLGSKFTFTMSF
jgi:hypothetical protein